MRLNSKRIKVQLNMATTNKTNNFVETMVEAQNNFVNEVLETTKNLTKDMPFVKETIDSTQKIYNETTESAKKMAEETSVKFEESTDNMKQTSEQTQNFFQQWFENQMNLAKTAFNNTGATANNANPFNFNFPNIDWMNGFSQANGYWTNMMNTNANPFMNNNPFNTWMNNNPFMNANNMQSKFNEGINTWGNYTKQYFDTMNNGFGDWSKNFMNPTAAESFKGMNNMAESLSKFHEMWMPMFKSMQDKTFNMEVYNQFMSPAKYKEFMDKFFSFMPDNMKQQFDAMNQQFVTNMKQMTDSGMNNFNAFKSQINSNPFMNANPFANMWTNYSQMNNVFADAVSPLTKLMADNSNFQAINTWNDIYNRMVEFNIKNNELQYMMYQQGTKVMDKTAEKMANKIQNGENIESIINIYQEWMMTGDELFTQMFASDEYSKLMTEVSSLQMKLKMDIDKQMEKMVFSHMPIATRTEMDEVYKNIYDLKKMYRNLEKMFNAANEANSETEAAPKATSKKK